jgi:hypothetical protein
LPRRQLVDLGLHRLRGLAGELPLLEVVTNPD